MDSYTEAEHIAPFQWRRVTTDGDVGFYVRAIGSEASYTVEVDAGGEITFKKGDLGSEAVDSNVGASGVIDTNAAAYDTYGELVAYLNSLDDYEAYLGDVLPADSSDDTLLIKTATQIKTDAGAPLYKDTSVALNISIAVSGEDFQHVESGSKNELQGYVGTPTGTGADTFKIYQGTTLVYQVAGPTTGVEASKNADEVQHGAKGERLLLRLDMATTMTAGALATMKRSVKLTPIRKRPA